MTAFIAKLATKGSQCLAGIILLLATAAATAAEFEEGVHYKLVDQPQPAAVADGQVLVEEAFWYGCSHCFNLEEVIIPWKKTKPDNVVFKGLPAMFGRPWVLHARLYYTAEVLGVLPQLHVKIFEAIHLKDQRLLSKTDQRNFVVEHAGVSAADFDKAYDSFIVNTRMSQGDQRVRSFGIDGVPALIVNGKYVVSGRTAGGRQQMIDVVNYLVKQEQATL